MNKVKLRGFASLSQERRKEVAATGGRRAHALKVAHRFTHDEAVEAGKKGKRRANLSSL